MPDLPPSLCLYFVSTYCGRILVCCDFNTENSQRFPITECTLVFIADLLTKYDTFFSTKQVLEQVLTTIVTMFISQCKDYKIFKGEVLFPIYSGISLLGSISARENFGCH